MSALLVRPQFTGTLDPAKVIRMTRTVVVFDICSSSVILEDLQQSGTQDRFGLLIDALWAYLLAGVRRKLFEIYKYLGDGFVLLFSESVRPDDVIMFLVNLTHYSNIVIAEFQRQYLDVAQLPRAGITIGVDLGQVYRLQSNATSRREYFGRPINIASRFQSSLDQPEHVNHVLVSREFYRGMENKTLRDRFSETSRSLRNMAGEKKQRCYYMGLEEFGPTSEADFIAATDELRGQLQDPILIRSLDSSSFEFEEFRQLLVQSMEKAIAEMWPDRSKR